MKRNPQLSESAARARVTSQMPLAEKRQRATLVVSNDDTQAALIEKAKAIGRQLQPVKSIMLLKYLVVASGCVLACSILIKWLWR